MRGMLWSGRKSPNLQTKTSRKKTVGVMPKTTFGGSVMETATRSKRVKVGRLRGGDKIRERGKGEAKRETSQEED